ncbi:MAG: MBL fold metallo-hydrolase [Saprospiraceae bacterium]|nr:MBL fold metallo-hydrolase [Saprospiraceae bacterium]
MSSKVQIVFSDVQHGHATYIKTPNNKHIVIDLGIGDFSGMNKAFSPLRHLKYNFGVQQLDYVIITHPHLDHIDDILNFDALSPKVFNRPRQITNAEVMREEEIIKTIRNQDRPKFEKYCEINDRYIHPVRETDNPDNPDNFGGMKIISFIPTTCSHNNFNNHSIVSIVEFAEIKVVIPGDNEACSFEELMKYESFKASVKDSDVLLAPHHGRENGYHNDFVNLVNPRLTVVSDGRFCDTSANGRYSQKSRGIKVIKGNVTSSERKCLTTNSDGEVCVMFGYKDDMSRFLSVNIL